MYEEWRPIQEAPKYEVSNFGAIRNIRTSRVIAGHILHNGYRQVNIMKDGKPIYRMAHCLVAEAFIGAKPGNAEVNHKDGNKLNNHFSNLEYITHRENMIHALRSLGNPGKKLTKEDAVNIRWALAQKIPQKVLAAQYGISKMTVSTIGRGKAWSDDNYVWRDGRKKLTTTSVQEIKLRLAAGEVHARIAKDYFVSDSTIDNIANGKSWSHVKG